MPKSIVIQTRLSEVAYRNFKSLCKKRKLTMSEIIRELIINEIKGFLESSAKEKK